MKCIIVDDEPLAREGMRNLLEEIPLVEVIAEFANALSALNFIKNNPVDLLFLDIEMPTLNGLDFAELLAEDQLIILTTAYPQYALKSYDLGAIDYLLKPIKKDRLIKAIEKAAVYRELLTRQESQHSFESSNKEALFIKSERKYYKVNFSDIRFIEALKDYVIIYTQDQKLITAMNLKTIHSKLPENTMLRVSKSYLVNLAFIDAFDNHTIYIDKFEIPIGDIYRDLFFRRYANDFR